MTLHTRIITEHPSKQFDRRIAVVDLDPTPRAKCASSPWPYPSPPMSGSTPPSQRAASDADDRVSVSSGYPSITSPNDAYRGSSIQSSPIEPLGYSEHLSRAFSYEPSERLVHAQRPGDLGPRPLSYPTQNLPSVTQGMTQQPYMSPGVSGSSQAYPAMGGQQPTPEGSGYTSPKSQRKAKGHVASACVPCKRAHLRCDGTYESLNHRFFFSGLLLANF
jgi:hypothetical protein